jgi:tetratricopeptide (TPR) repeat protein
MATTEAKPTYVTTLRGKLAAAGWRHVEPSPELSQWPHILTASPKQRVFAVEWWPGEEPLHFSVITSFAEMVRELASTTPPDVDVTGVLVTSQEWTARLRAMALTFEVIFVTYDAREPVELASERVRELCAVIDDAGTVTDPGELTVPESSRWTAVAGYPELRLRDCATIAVQPGALQTARELYGRMVRQQEETLGPDHAYTLATRTDLALLLWRAGDTEAAKLTYTEIIAIQADSLGRDHPNTLRTRRLLASLNADPGGGDIAELKSLLADTERVLGPDDRTTLGTRDELAAAYEAAGQVNAAIELRSRGLDDRERLFGPDDPGTIAERHNLAHAYEAAERPDEAIPHYERALADSTRILRPPRADALNTAAGLGRAYREAMRVNEAIDLLERVVADSERELGQDHPVTLKARDDLATTYAAPGADRLDEAITLHERNLEVRRSLYGDDHPDTLDSMNNLASAYLKRERVDDSIALYEAALTGRTDVLGADNLKTLESENNLGAAYQEAGRLTEAADHYEHALRGLERVLGTDAPLTTKVRLNLDEARDRLRRRSRP